MIKTFILLVSLLLLTTVDKISSECTDRVCCADDCSPCGPCVGNMTIDASCCEEVILKSDRSCNKYSVPCYIATVDSDEDNNFFKNVYDNLGLVNIILLSITVLICGCYIYACCCFDKRKPPVDYIDLTIEKIK